MPSTKGLELLVRKTKPDYGEWLELLEARRSLLKPHLDSITLQQLGDVKCLLSESFDTPLRLGLRLSAHTSTGDARFSLKTQGIFAKKWQSTHIPNTGFQAYPGGISSPDGFLYLWGLTRDALWILVKVDFHGEAGYKNRGKQAAVSVDIQEANPARIVEETSSTALDIWQRLGEATHGWLQDRRMLFLQIEELVHQVMAEEQALSVIQEQG